jgi:hypothetical protein
MYQVILKSGIQTNVLDYPSKSMANNYVLEKASEMGLDYGYDMDGFAFAHNDVIRPSEEIFILEISEI